MNMLLLFLLVGCLVVEPVRSLFDFGSKTCSICKDLDPCSKNPCDHICKKLIFGYQCSCRPGFLLNIRDKKTCIPIVAKCDQGFERSKSDPTKCVDINECAQKPSPCGQTCSNYEGSYECSCRSGFILSDKDYKTCLPSVTGCDQGYEPSKSNPSKCVDLNECAQKVPPCGQICTNYEGSYECSCRKGFVLSDKDYKSCLPTTKICDQGFEPSKSDPHKCVDINECETKKPCGQICTNYEGSYECSCNTHFTLSETDYSTCIPNKCDDGFEKSKSDPTKCVDIDECDREQKPCGQICTNYEGSYECSCRPGFSLSDTDYKSCHQIDNCKSTPCEQICESVETSYKCSCREGYVISKSDPKKCEVIDFCKNKPCQHTCTSTPNGYSCSCNEGFQINIDDPTKCTAIDYCKNKPCEQMCTSTTTTYKCSCKEGFQISQSDPTKCEVKDPCESTPCQQKCTSTTTGFKCSCNQGFEISKTDATKCEATNFCKGEPCQQVCTSTATEFKCSCNQGFEISKTDATKCEAINYCKSEPCEQVCTSSTTGFKCSCNEGFLVSKSDPNKCEVIPCPEKYFDLVFVIDSSGTITREKYPANFEFVETFLHSFKIGENMTRVALITFGTNPRLIFNNTGDKAFILNKLKNVAFQGSSTQAGRAIRFVLEKGLAGDPRPGVDRIIVLVTDGKSTNATDTMLATAQAKDQGFAFVCVGVGKSLDWNELGRVASKPEYVFKANDYDALENMAREVSETACDERQT